MEFAFIHSPDWYIIPYQMEVGTISQVKSLIITDCFGDKISIEPAGRTVKELTMSEADKSWDSWSMFLLSKKYEDKGQQTEYTLLLSSACC